MLNLIAELLLVMKPTFMHYPEIQHTYLAMDSQICFHRQLSYTHEDTLQAHCYP